MCSSETLFILAFATGLPLSVIVPDIAENKHVLLFFDIALAPTNAIINTIKRENFTIHPPTNTVGHPKTILPPCAVESPIRAAGLLLMSTVALPITIESGGPTQTHMLPIVAAGILPISTVGAPGETIGPPT
jgi:hypothetical protein